MNSEEFEQWVHALLVMEELCRKVTVEELNAISNGLGKSWAGERSVEWFEVQLKHKVAIGTAIESSSDY